MRQIAFLFLLVILSSSGAAGQDADSGVVQSLAIEKVEISGVPEQSLSSSLREDLQKLIGQPYDAQLAAQYADRIQSELSQYVAAPRTVPGTQPDLVRLIFVVAQDPDGSIFRIGDLLKLNINAQYTVEAVEFDGLSRSQFSDELYADMQKMVGQRLDNAQAEQLRQRLATELKPAYQVFRSVRRGAQPQHVKVVYRGRKVPWLPSRNRESFIVYHSKEGFSGAFSQHAGQNWATINWELANSADELIERYAGFRLGFESLKLGSERLGVKLDYSSYRAQWERQTLEAEQEAPGNLAVYRIRRTVEPSVAFAFSRNLYVTAGSSLSELQMQSPEIHSESAHAAVGSVHYRHEFQGRAFHLLDAGYEVRAAAHTLNSDFIYTRQSFTGHYAFKGDKNVNPENIVTFDFWGGMIAGSPPLFERFTLGDTRMLRGWNKFDVAPLGGNRVLYGSLGYRYKMVQLFYDSGAIWDAGQAIQARQSVGFGFRETAKTDSGRCYEKREFLACWFINVAIPLRNSRLEPTITMGVGF